MLCALAHALVQELLSAKRDLGLPRALRKLGLFEVTLLDDLGCVQPSPDEAEVLFTRLAELHERRSVMVTSILAFSERDQIFRDEMATAVAIDRLYTTLWRSSPTSQATERTDSAASRRRHLPPGAVLQAVLPGPLLPPGPPTGDHVNARIVREPSSRGPHLRRGRPARVAVPGCSVVTARFPLRFGRRKRPYVPPASLLLTSTTDLGGHPNPAISGQLKTGHSPIADRDVDAGRELRVPARHDQRLHSTPFHPYAGTAPPGGQLG